MPKRRKPKSKVTELPVVLNTDPAADLIEQLIEGRDVRKDIVESAIALAKVIKHRRATSSAKAAWLAIGLVIETVSTRKGLGEDAQQDLYSATLDVIGDFWPPEWLPSIENIESQEHP